MHVDYSEYGDFEPVAINFKYIVFKYKKLIVKLPEGKRELFINLYNFKNEENIVVFRIEENEKKLFQKNFLEKYTLPCHPNYLTYASTLPAKRDGYFHFYNHSNSLTRYYSPD